MSASPERPRAVGPDRDPFARLGRLAVRRRWWIVGAWAVLLLVAVPLAPRVVGALRAGGFILEDLESARAKALLQTELGVPPSAGVVGLPSDAPLARRPALPAPAGAARPHRGGAAGGVRGP